MALNIKNQEVENLLNSVVKMTGESKTEAVRKALEERQRRLAMRFPIAQDRDRLHTFLAEEIWPQIPSDLIGAKLSREEEEAFLGFGELGI